MTQVQLTGIQACVFDAYGTLFDVNAAAARCRDDLGDDADTLAKLWREKQLQYTWLRSLMRRHADFWQVTGEALDYALAVLGRDDPELRQRLMDLYRIIDAYPEVPRVLERLKDAGTKTAILSNGAPTMLASAVDKAGIVSLLDDVLSVEDVGIFKPDPAVYQLAVSRLGVPAEGICFLSSNAWDVAGAATFGLRCVWVNRSGQPPERLPGEPVAQLPDLGGLPELLGL